MSRETDLEKRYPDGIPSGIMSDELWRDFRRSDEQWCCRALRYARDGEGQGKWSGRLIINTGGKIVYLKVMFCPCCGRKLQ